jgi:hypothetical protein
LPPWSNNRDYLETPPKIARQTTRTIQKRLNDCDIKMMNTDKSGIRISTDPMADSQPRQTVLHADPQCWETATTI